MKTKKKRRRVKEHLNSEQFNCPIPLPPLIGTDEKIREAEPIRLKQVDNLLTIKCLVNPTSIYGPLFYQFIDDLINRQSAQEWLDTQFEDYDYDSLREALGINVEVRMAENQRADIATEWLPDRQEFTNWMLALIGTKEDVVEATPIRQKQAADLLELKCTFPSDAVTNALVGVCIDSALDRTEAKDWIKTKAIKYDFEWLQDALVPFIINMIQDNQYQAFPIKPFYIICLLIFIGEKGIELEFDNAMELADKLVYNHKPGFLDEDNDNDSYTPAEVRALISKLASACKADESSLLDKMGLLCERPDENLPSLFGTKEGIEAAHLIRQKQIPELLACKDFLDPSCMFSNHASDYIDTLINRQSAATWIKTQMVSYTKERISNAVKPTIISSLRVTVNQEQIDAASAVAFLKAIGMGVAKMEENEAGKFATKFVAHHKRNSTNGDIYTPAELSEICDQFMDEHGVNAIWR